MSSGSGSDSEEEYAGIPGPGNRPSWTQGDEEDPEGLVLALRNITNTLAEWKGHGGADNSPIACKLFCRPIGTKTLKELIMGQSYTGT